MRESFEALGLILSAGVNIMSQTGIGFFLADSPARTPIRDK
jgi:hypothetical protein